MLRVGTVHVPAVLSGTMSLSAARSEPSDGATNVRPLAELNLASDVDPPWLLEGCCLQVEAPEGVGQAGEAEDERLAGKLAADGLGLYEMLRPPKLQPTCESLTLNFKIERDLGDGLDRRGDQGRYGTASGPGTVAG